MKVSFAYRVRGSRGVLCRHPQDEPIEVQGATEQEALRNAKSQWHLDPETAFNAGLCAEPLVWPVREVAR